MNVLELFNENYGWYKGNLHAHTNISDGVLSPLEAISLYEKNGYNFLSLTDHRIASNERVYPNFLVLSGIEMHVNDYTTRKAYHIIGVGFEGEVKYYENRTPQELIDIIMQHNGLAILAHPSWSLLTHQDALTLKGYHGIEIFNTISETKSNRGNSIEYVDTVASKGLIKLIFAVDDTHHYSEDLFGGYIMVNSPSLDRVNILQNIKDGNFYATQGPQIKQITVENREIFVETSPVVQVSFMSDDFYNDKRVVKSRREFLTSANYECSERDNWVRIECMDVDGKKAWSQYIKISQIFNN